MLIVGIQGTELSKPERAWLAEPEVAGVILFARNYLDREQLRTLITSIRSCRDQPLLVSVDQEGGVVQRFRKGFTTLPALAVLGRLWRHDSALARQRTEEHAWVMASELRASDVDISFAPVLDLARGNRAIGTRALHADPEIVADLGQAYVRGMRMAGMAVTVKHFPGHGSVLEDTHIEKACDPRPVEVLFKEDLEPFRAALAAGAEAVMMAHVSYPAFDLLPAGYSCRWIGEVLRGQLGFTGVVISDDVGMNAAAQAGGVAARIQQHEQAGCNLLLVCTPALVDEALQSLRGRVDSTRGGVSELQGGVASTWEELVDNPQYQRFVERLGELDQHKEPK